MDFDEGGSVASVAIPSAPDPPASPPPEEPPPPPVWSPRALWDPAGEPGPCRAAAIAWRHQGEVMATLANTLGEIGEPLPGFWQGEAADGQAESSLNLISEIGDAARQCHEIADALDQMAGQIEEFNDSIHELWITIASIAAISIVGSFFTFGASGVAGAAATGAAVARGGALLNALRATLALARPLFSLRAANFATYGARWMTAVRGISFTPRFATAAYWRGFSLTPRFTTAGYGGRVLGFYKTSSQVFAGGLPFTFINKRLSGDDPFDARNWRVEDLTASLWGAALFGGMGSKLLPFGKVAPRAPGSGFPGWLGYHGRAISTAWPGFRRGLVFGSMGEPIARFVFYDNPVNQNELTQAGANIAGSTGTGFGLAAIWNAYRGPATTFRGGVVRSFPLFIPGTIIAYWTSRGQGTQIVPQRGTPLFPWLAEAPGMPSDFPQQLPAAPAPLTPPTPTLRVVARPGESFWDFAERVYGDGREYTRIVAANHLLLVDPNNPDLINPGQEFLIPPLPRAA